MVGMRRPKKQKVEGVEEAAEDAAEVDGEAGATGEVPGAPPPRQASPPPATSPPSPGAAQREEAEEIYEDAAIKVRAIKRLAKEAGDAEKVAERLHQRKMARLEAGDRLGRRKSTFGAAKRTL